MTSRAFEGDVREMYKYTGHSLVQMLETELDRATHEHNAGKYQSLYSDGRLMGLATAIAITRVPYSWLGRKAAPDFDSVVSDVLASSAARVAAAAAVRHSK